MIAAGIDIGSNTILMVVAEIRADGSMSILQDLQEIPRLGQGVQATGSIQEEAIVRAEGVLSLYANTIRELNVERVRVAATSALRVASNQVHVLDRLEAALGSSIEVVTGDNEAQLTFAGVASTRSRGETMVIDIGGGSTEVSLGNEQGLQRTFSTEVGCVRLHESYYDPQRGFSANFQEVRSRIQKSLAGLGSPPSPLPTVIGVSGTPTALVMLKRGLDSFDASSIDGSMLTKDDVRDLCEDLSDPRSTRFPNMAAIPAARAEILPSGSAILLEIMELWSVPHVEVSTRGLRHGLLNEVSPP